MNLHKILFPAREKQIETLEARFKGHSEKSIKDTQTIIHLKNQIQVLESQTPDEMENLMRASLGLPYIRFDNIEKDAKGNDNPPHYLKGLDQQARLTYLADLSQIFRNPHFQEVMDWHVNVLGNHSMQKASDADMRNGRIGIIAFRGFRKEFEDADAEYMESNRPEEDFDKHSVLAG